MPAVGGRIGPEQLLELRRGLVSDVAFVVESRILNDPEGIPTALRAFHRTMRELGPSSV